MAEAVLADRPAALLDDQVESLEVGESPHELLARDDHLEELGAERASDHGRERQQLARFRVEAVEPCLERALDERRDGQLVERDAQLPAAVPPPERAALDEVLERLLEEERVTARPLCEDLGDVLGNLSLRSFADERSAGVRRERPKLDLAVAVRVELARPLAELPRLELALAPVEEEERDRGLLGDRQERLEQLEGRLVRPVEILEYDAERHVVGEANQAAPRSSKVWLWTLSRFSSRIRCAASGSSVSPMRLAKNG